MTSSHPPDAGAKPADSAPDAPAQVAQNLAAQLAQVAQNLAQTSSELAQIVAQIAPDAHMVLSSAFDFDLGGKSETKTPANKGVESKRCAYPGAFLEFWGAYPLKRDKRKALPAWERALRRIAPGASGASGPVAPGALVGANAVLIAGAKRYAEDPNRVEQFTKYAEGWLNGDCWEDDPLPIRNGHVPKYDPARATYEQAQRLREVEDGSGRSARVGGAPRGSLPPGAP